VESSSKGSKSKSNTGSTGNSIYVAKTLIKIKKIKKISVCIYVCHFHYFLLPYLSR
jgi:hypothetical protein